MAAARRIRRDHVQGNKRSRGLISAFICGAAVYGAAKLIAVHVCMYVCICCKFSNGLRNGREKLVRSDRVEGSIHLFRYPAAELVSSTQYQIKITYHHQLSLSESLVSYLEEVI